MNKQKFNEMHIKELPPSPGFDRYTRELYSKSLTNEHVSLAERRRWVPLKFEDQRQQNLKLAKEFKLAMWTYSIIISELQHAMMWASERDDRASFNRLRKTESKYGRNFMKARRIEGEHRRRAKRLVKVVANLKKEFCES